MKNLRFILALAVAGAFALNIARAGDDKAKSAEKPVCTMDCKKDKDGKFTCSKDGGKTCCCGAEGKAEKKDDKKEGAEHKH
jgi:hypothetical protein